MSGSGRSLVVDEGLPRAGDIIADKFLVKSVLGRGGMGIVVAVDHLQLREPYAMKFLLPHAVENTETVERFLREARAAVRIKSEHVARVTDVGQLPDGAPYLLMEYLEGTDLASRMEAGPLPIAEAIEYVLQAAAGIAEAHALGIIHRDLKPSNLFLTRRSDGAPLIKVLDFGIAKAAETANEGPALTATQAVFGTPAYMSPEQIRSAKNVDFRTDIWSLGVILYELVTGALPFKGGSAAALLAAISADEPTPLHDRRPAAPKELEALILRCLAKDRKQRFATISELVVALSALAPQTSVVSVGRIARLGSPAMRAEAAATTPRTHSSRGHSTGTADTLDAAAPRLESRRLLLFIAPVVLIAVVATALVTLKLAGRPAPPPIPDPTVAPLPSVAPVSAPAIATTEPQPAPRPAPAPSAVPTGKVIPRARAAPLPVVIPPVPPSAPPAPRPNPTAESH